MIAAARLLWVASACLLVVACTSSEPQPAPSPRPPVQAWPLPTAGAVPPPVPSDTAGAAAPLPCRPTRGADLDLSRTWRSPEAALAAVARRPAHTYDAVVSVGTVEFYPRDRSRSYRVESVEDGWTVGSWSAPGCRPRALALGGAGDADPRKLACQNPQWRLYDRSYDQPSALDAVHAELAGDYANPLPRGRYVAISRNREPPIFGLFRGRDLVAALWVLHAKSGFGVESASWC
jgi:hypothetical protein